MDGNDTQRSNDGDVGSVASYEGSDKGTPKGDQTNQSGRVTFPNSMKSGASSPDSELSAGHVPTENPFTMPPDNDIFLVRDRERQKKKNERLRQRTLKVHEKTTTTSKIGFRQAAMIKGPEIEARAEAEEGAAAVKDDPQFTIAVTRDRQVEKETLSEYISKKREMFLLQYSLGVKRDEMRKLEDIAVAEEKKLELAEQYLEEDAAMFDDFLKENDKNSVEAIRIAEEEAKAKLNKVAEIKRLNTSMMQIKSEINKYEEQLKEYKMYKRFLDRLIPDEIRKEREEARKNRREEKRRLKEEAELERERSDASSKASRRGQRRVRRTPGEKERSRERPPSEDAVRPEEEGEDDSSDDEDLELYFTDPQQLLDIFTELEESNLSLIQNCQETEESLEEMRQTTQLTKEKMNRETAILAEQIDRLKKAISKEEEKASELELKSKMFSFGEFQAEDQERMLSELNDKVEGVYRTCIGDNEANISTLQMLTNIENRIEELFQMIEMMPQDKVEAAQKAKEKERRLKMREEKKEQQRLHQEERVRKALERAKAAPKKQTGRRPMPRSNPPLMKKKDDGLSDQRSREEEELAYFFT